jgi:hypothetical protein
MWDDLLKAILDMAKRDYLCRYKAARKFILCQVSPYKCYQCKQTAKEYVLG